MKAIGNRKLENWKLNFWPLSTFFNVAAELIELQRWDCTRMKCNFLYFFLSITRQWNIHLMSASFFFVLLVYQQFFVAGNAAIELVVYLIYTCRIFAIKRRRRSWSWKTTSPSGHRAYFPSFAWVCIAVINETWPKQFLLVKNLISFSSRGIFYHWFSGKRGAY